MQDTDIPCVYILVPLLIVFALGREQCRLWASGKVGRTATSPPQHGIKPFAVVIYLSVYLKWISFEFAVDMCHTESWRHGPLG